MLYALFFLLGVLLTNFFQTILNINPLYKIWKIGEYGFLRNLLQSEILRHQSLAVVKICYDEANKQEEYEKIEKAVNNKFLEYQEASIRVIKKLLPYETNYNDTKEAMKWIEGKLKNEEMEDG